MAPINSVSNESILRFSPVFVIFTNKAKEKKNIFFSDTP